jgi:hypothetical protein
VALGVADGLLQELAIADGACSAAKATPISGEGRSGPAKLISGKGNGLIGATGPAMEQEMHRAAMGLSQKLKGDQGHGPGEITTATGHDHQRRGHWMQGKGNQCSGWTDCRRKKAHQRSSNERWMDC